MTGRIAVASALAILLLAGGVVAQTPPKLLVSPSKGQSKEQQSKDTTECAQRAKEQAASSQAQHAAPAGAQADLAGAFSACMEGRGYSVK